MRLFSCVLLLAIIAVPLAYADSGMVSMKSHHSVSATADRLEALLAKKGVTVFCRIDHAQGAQKIGKELRPTELIIFGNPKVGTPLMQCLQLVAIDLPQKALIWEDEAGQVWFSYNSPQYLAKRHGIKGCAKALEKVETVLANFARASVKP